MRGQVVDRGVVATGVDDCDMVVATPEEVDGGEEAAGSSADDDGPLRVGDRSCCSEAHSFATECVKGPFGRLLVSRTQRGSREFIESKRCSLERRNIAIQNLQRREYLASHTSYFIQARNMHIY